MKITAYTDYPINNDHSVKLVEVLRYDRNKYAHIQWGDISTDVKSGYLFEDKQLVKRVSNKKLYSLPISDGGKTHSKKEVTNTLKLESRKTIKYCVWTESKKFYFRNLHDALKKASHLDNFELLRMNCTPWENYTVLLSLKDKALDVYGNNRNMRNILKTKHLDIYFP